MKLYIIAGEASGDLHGADLIRELKKIIPSLQIRGWGGDLMKAEGVEIVKHFKDLSFMGFAEVIMNLRTILKNIKFCKNDLLYYKPDAVILIDYPGFNIRIAEFAKENNLPVYYYISPQVWAWKSSRVNKIREIVNKMFVILPFEKEFYKKYDYDVEYVGHPLPDVISRKRKLFAERTHFLKRHTLMDKPIIAILPGSRRQEISAILPLMLSVLDSFPGYQFVIAVAPSLPINFYREIIGDKEVSMVSDETYELLFHSEAALVTSGTATLETALLNVPQVVCYKGGAISYFIAKILIKIKYISLVNLIMDRVVVKELIQNSLKTESLIVELNNILDPANRKNIFKDYNELIEKLSAGGAANKAAAMIIDDLNLNSR